MPLLVHPVLRALRVHAEAIQHARLADRKVGDVDHLLHFAEPFGQDLAVLQRHQRAEVVLVLAQLLAEQTDCLAALGSGHVPPVSRRQHRRREHVLVVFGARRPNLRQQRRVSGVADVEEGAILRNGPAVRSGPGPRAHRLQSEPRENGVKIGSAHRTTACCLPRWRPVLPLTTTSPETSLVPPGA